MPRKKTNEEFIADIKYFYGEEFTLVGAYTHNNSPITLRHTCGHEFTVARAFKLFSAGRFCPKCGKPAVDKQFILDSLKTLYNGEYKGLRVSKPISYTSRLTVKHKPCGEVLYTTVQDFIFNKKLCPECKSGRLKVGIDEFKARVKEWVGDEYTVLSTKMQGVDTKVKMRHNTCGHEYEVTPGHFKAGKRCPKCNNDNRRLSFSDLQKKVAELTNGEFTVAMTEPYMNVGQFAQFTHLECGSVTSIPIRDFLYHGYRCQACNISRGEAAVGEYLTRNGIKYLTEAKLPGCVYKGDLKFDFLFKYKGALLAIEYNGIQHYKAVEFFGGEAHFELTKKRDRAKRDFCKKKGIRILSIPYNYGTDVDEVIQAFLSKLQ